MNNKINLFIHTVWTTFKHMPKGLKLLTFLSIWSLFLFLQDPVGSLTTNEALLIPDTFPWKDGVITIINTIINASSAYFLVSLFTRSLLGWKVNMVVSITWFGIYLARTLPIIARLLSEPTSKVYEILGYINIEPMYQNETSYVYTKYAYLSVHGLIILFMLGITWYLVNKRSYFNK